MYLSIFFNSFTEILNSDIQTLLVLNIVGIVMTVFMLLIDWNILFSNHKLVFIKPKRFFGERLSDEQQNFYLVY